MSVNRISILASFIAISLAASGFVAGVIRSREVLHDLAENVAAHPQNSFGRCLTELWELSGELDPEWKGKRKWVLTEQ